MLYEGLVPWYRRSSVKYVVLVVVGVLVFYGLLMLGVREAAVYLSQKPKAEQYEWVAFFFGLFIIWRLGAINDKLGEILTQLKKMNGD